MMMLASPISSRPVRWCTPTRVSGHAWRDFVNDARECADGQRLVGLVFEERDAAALIVVADQSDERRDGAVTLPRL